MEPMLLHQSPLQSFVRPYKSNTKIGLTPLERVSNSKTREKMATGASACEQNEVIGDLHALPSPLMTIKTARCPFLIEPGHQAGVFLARGRRSILSPVSAVTDRINGVHFRPVLQSVVPHSELEEDVGPGHKTAGDSQFQEHGTLLKAGNRE